MFKLVALGIAPTPGQFGLTKGKVITSLTQKELWGGFEEQPLASLLSQVIREV